MITSIKRHTVKVQGLCRVLFGRNSCSYTSSTFAASKARGVGNKKSGVQSREQEIRIGIKNGDKKKTHGTVNTFAIKMNSPHFLSSVPLHLPSAPIFRCHYTITNILHRQDPQWTIIMLLHVLRWKIMCV